MPTRRTLPKLTRARLDAAGAVELPAADDGVEHAVHVRAEAPAAADRDAPVPLHLDRVPHVGGRVHHAAVVQAEERRAALERVLVAAVDLEAARQPAPQLDLQRVVVAERLAVVDVARRRRPG